MSSAMDFSASSTASRARGGRYGRGGGRGGRGGRGGGKGHYKPKLALVSSFDLNTTNGVRDALAEIKGIKCALNNRRRALEARATVEGVSSKEDEDSDGSKAT
ncbi:hypothetical protein VF21_10330 [Pseudogymnoascus sp. 05NY08]|nr:hypothetical protein VF21_10330 [Pseudogymnoascus sp. 05NY08]